MECQISQLLPLYSMIFSVATGRVLDDTRITSVFKFFIKNTKEACPTNITIFRQALNAFIYNSYYPYSTIQILYAS